jgi:hypothetical protein
LAANSLKTLGFLSVTFGAWRTRTPTSGKVETLTIDPRDMLAGCSLEMRLTGFCGEAGASRIELAPAQRM